MISLCTYIEIAKFKLQFTSGPKILNLALKINDILESDIYILDENSSYIIINYNLLRTKKKITTSTFLPLVQNGRRRVEARDFRLFFKTNNLSADAREGASHIILLFRKSELLNIIYIIL